MEADLETLEGIIEHNRFLITGKAGNGSWGGVYKAVDREFDEIVAIKVLDPSELALQQMAERNLDAERAMRKEARPLKATSNIVPSWSDRDKNSKPFLVMPFYKRFLSDTIDFESGDRKFFYSRDYKLDLDTILKYMTGIASGLSELHTILGRAHGDLKPDNIALDEFGNALIADLGSSTLSSFGSVSPRDNIGFIATRAPECFKKGNRPKRSSDVWAFGSLAYRLFTGEYIFEKELQENDPETFYESIEPVWNKTIKRKLKRVPRRFRRLLKSCLEYHTYKRLSDGNALKQELDLVLESLNVYKQFIKFSRSVVLPLALPVVLVAATLYLAATHEPTQVTMPKPYRSHGYVDAPEGIDYIREQLDLPSVDANIEEEDTIRIVCNNKYVAGLMKAHDRAIKFLNRAGGKVPYISEAQFDMWAAYTQEKGPGSGGVHPYDQIGKSIEVGLVQSLTAEGQVDLEDACAIARLGIDVVNRARRAANSFDFKDYIDAKDPTGWPIIPIEEQDFLKNWLAYINLDVGPPSADR